MLYLIDRITQDLKLTKQKYIGLLRPHFCLLHKIFDVTVLAKPFIFYKTLWNFVLATNLPCDVWSNAIIWRNQNKSALTLCVWREVSRVHTFGPRVRNVNTAYSRDVSKGQKRGKHNRGRPDDQKTLTAGGLSPSIFYCRRLNSMRLLLQEARVNASFHYDNSSLKITLKSHSYSENPFYKKKCYTEKLSVLFQCNFQHYFCLLWWERFKNRIFS